MIQLCCCMRFDDVTVWVLMGMVLWAVASLKQYFSIWSDFDRTSSLICGNKMPTRCNICFLLQILLLAQHVSGTIMPIIRSSRVLYRWLLPVVFGALVFSPQTGHITLSSTPYWQLENQAPETTGGNQLYNTPELLMLGIMVPKTCWTSNKICNKKHLLHLVGILFPHSISQLCGTVAHFQTVPNSAEFLPKVIWAHGSLIEKECIMSFHINKFYESFCTIFFCLLIIIGRQ
jgi:hypothetical protein